jgi:hypothetical protein
MHPTKHDVAATLAAIREAEAALAVWSGVVEYLLLAVALVGVGNNPLLADRLSQVRPGPVFRLDSLQVCVLRGRRKRGNGLVV